VHKLLQLAHLAAHVVQPAKTDPQKMNPEAGLKILCAKDCEYEFISLPA
jgi:hypothetical protein